MNENQIKQRIEEILSDERLTYPSASVHINAALALIQISLQVELHTLQRVLGVKLTSINELRGE